MGCDLGLGIEGLYHVVVCTSRIKCTDIFADDLH